VESRSAIYPPPEIISYATYDVVFGFLTLTLILSPWVHSRQVKNITTKI